MGFGWDDNGIMQRFEKQCGKIQANEDDYNMQKDNFVCCFHKSPVILTEGAVGLRLEKEFGLSPDADIMYAALIYSDKGRRALEIIYRQYLQTAQNYELPILLMTNTRRANKDRVLRSAYKDQNVMYDYSAFLHGLTREYRCNAFVGGMMGCKGDAYSGTEGLSPEEAEEFHSWQASAFQNAPIDFLFAGIMPAKDEAAGMARTMEKSELPYIISLMVNKDGMILDGHTVHDAIQEIDGAVKQKPLCYVTNCIHPDILKEALGKPFNQTELVKERFRGIQANASCLASDKLDISEELKTTDAKDFTQRLSLLVDDFPIKILGGCCGTDNTHIEEIAMHFSMKNSLQFREKAYGIVKDIPPGFVLTYGIVALMAGRPQNARMAGKFLSQAPDDVPAHRVINHEGRTAPGWTEQRVLLEAEGVAFKENGFVDMRKHLWKSI